MVVFDFCWESRVAIFFVFVAYFFYALAFISNLRLLKTLTHYTQVRNLWSGTSGARKWLLFLFNTFAFGLLILILLRPKWGLVKQKVVREGRNIVFALDLSRSMLAKDLSPSRLEFAKFKIKDLFKKLGPERFALIFFSDKAYMHCPFTTDRTAFFSFLNQVGTTSTSGGGTSLAKALDEAVFTFQNVFPDLKKRVVILITDCEDFSPDIERAIAQAKAANINVVILVCATEHGAPVPIVDRQGKEVGHEKDSSGQVVITKLNKELVDQLSKGLGAQIVPISFDNSDVEQIFKFINKFEKEKFENKNLKLYREQQSFFSAAFFVLWAILWFL